MTITEADAWLNGFIKKHGLGTVYERFSDSLPHTASEFVDWVIENYNAANQGPFANLGNISNIVFDSVLEHDGQYHLLKPDIVLDQWIDTNLSISERAAMRKKKPELRELISGDGKGTTVRTINGKTRRTVLLKTA
ncbi:hypothetical protein [Hydrogenovibrio halophilus]|uniref:hypothetical protein n=1 Tax=Hydrogenovibrio halophilus TaxID=373391 RepID=UPI00037EEB52|nr:hypothetical protein [Hydrogenovibrio halophilus]